VTQDRRAELRRIFDTAADRYDLIRPSYPQPLFDDLVSLNGLRPGQRILEIGPGTGQATLDLARRGFAVIAVELGPALAQVARRNLASYPQVEVVTADFETWPLPAELFDAVVSATTFHWLDSNVRLVKVAQALASGGVVALIDTDHVAGGTERFFVDVQACYERWDPSSEPGLRLPSTRDVTVDLDEMTRGGLFSEATFRRYETDISYSADEYIDLLLTYSGHLDLAPDLRAGLLECIRSLITDKYGGRITKRYLTTLRLAMKAST
jgi:SAM-dependent methyltransferase